MPEIVEQILGLLILLGVGIVLIIALLVGLLYRVLTHPPKLTAGTAAARGWPIDPNDNNLTFTEWILERPGKVILPVWEIFNDAKPQGPVTIVSHCWGGSRIESLQRVPFLLPYSSRLILWDMRGHGESTGGISTIGTAEIDDLLYLIDRVSADTTAPIILYGYSMGAGISICAATKEDKVIGVIADGPYRWTAEPVREMMRERGVPYWPALPIVHRILCLRFRDLRNSDRAKYAAQLTCPLMVIHGTDDPFCSINSSMEIAETAPEADFIVIPHAAHLDLHITNPERYQQTIQSFIRKCLNRVK